MIAITGATGQLGHLVLQNLLKTTAASQIVAIVRNPAKAEALSQQGIVVRQADYTDEAAFTAALQGVDKLLRGTSGDAAVAYLPGVGPAQESGLVAFAHAAALREGKHDIVIVLPPGRGIVYRKAKS